MVKIRLARFTAIAAALGMLLSAPRVSAEIAIGEAGGWTAAINGKANGFLSYTFGDALPVAPALQPTRRLIDGGGLKGGRIRERDVNGDRIPGDAGTISRLRVRSGFVPNVLGFSVKKQVAESLQLKGVFSVWGTIETAGLGYSQIVADFREGYGHASGPWGAVTIGRHLGLFSRGIVRMNFKYMHQYGVGYPGGLNGPGPTAGMIGFGVLAAFFQPGIMYTSPDLGGLQLNVGLYDPVQIAGSWEVTREPRPEFEFTYDWQSEETMLHLFVNGAYQKLYDLSQNEETMLGAGFGGSAEFGPFHFGAGGHYGTGLGLYYALEGGDTSFGTSDVSPGGQANEPRTFLGLSAYAQYSPGNFDVNLAIGQSRVELTEQDIIGPQALETSLIKTQTAVAAAFVYHLNERVHWDIDYLRAMFRWYKLETQDVNFINTGITIDW